MTKELKMKGRLLPDSALTTYFGKPAFHVYGNGNINPVNAGISTGDNLKTHNINPHSGANQPKTLQVYKRALRGHQKVLPSKKKKIVTAANHVRVPQPPRYPTLKRSLTTKNLTEEPESPAHHFEIKEPFVKLPVRESNKEDL